MEYVKIIVMVLTFIFGIAGTLIAKKARKKSSYPLLLISGFMAVLTLIGLITAIILILFVK